MDKEIRYINGIQPPSFSKMQRWLLKLNQVPVIRNIKCIKKMICNIYGIPHTTSFGKDFSCSAPVLNLKENVTLANTCIIAWAPVNIGCNCSFSFRNMIITSTHDLYDFSVVIGKPVTIGDNVWITSNVTILPGVTIGSNSVIGAGSVVTKDIPSGVFAAGNPCKVIKKINFKIN